MPSSVNAPAGPSTAPPERTTGWIGSAYFFAKAKSRSSCAGTLMIAPVPTSMRTKFAAQIGISSCRTG